MKTISVLLALATAVMPAAAQAADRSTTVLNWFKRDNPCPSGQTGGGCGGYTLDHIIPFSMGGPDHKDNLQWQTTEDAKKKDLIECDGHKCGRRP